MLEFVLRLSSKAQNISLQQGISQHKISVVSKLRSLVIDYLKMNKKELFIWHFVTRKSCSGRMASG